jgi:5-methylcytosine-specific restriction endonuclease McrA
MKNRWKIPNQLVKEVFERDKACVYCGIVFTDEPVSFRERRSWEHIANNAKIVTLENIALCCRGCNSSKGAKLLEAWLDSPYCKRRNIRKDTVAQVVKEALLNPPTLIS